MLDTLKRRKQKRQDWREFITWREQEKIRDLEQDKELDELRSRNIKFMKEGIRQADRALAVALVVFNTWLYYCIWNLI